MKKNEEMGWWIMKDEMMEMMGAVDVSDWETCLLNKGATLGRK